MNILRLITSNVRAEAVTSPPSITTFRGLGASLDLEGSKNWSSCFLDHVHPRLGIGALLIAELPEAFTYAVQSKK